MNADPRTHKPGLHAWATAGFIALALGVPMTCSVNRAAREINAEHNEVLRRQTWCPTPEQRAGVHEPVFQADTPEPPPVAEAEPEPSLCVFATVEVDVNRKLIRKLNDLAEKCQEPGMDLRTIRSRIRWLINDLDERNEAIK